MVLSLMVLLVIKKFGVSGEFENVKNYLTDPLDKNRNIFMFSDAPHFMKTVCDRIYIKKYLKVSYIICIISQT